MNTSESTISGTAGEMWKTESRRAKISCAGQDQLPEVRGEPGPAEMGVLAYNLLHMIGSLCSGEAVERSMEWLIKRSIKVGRQGFLSCPEVVCPCGLRLSSGSPLQGGAGVGS